MSDKSPQRESTGSEIEQRTPFQDEAQLLSDPNALHDDISRVTTQADEAAEVASEHTRNLLYDPGYIYDPRSSPHGARYYPGPSSGETEAEQR